MLIEKYINPKDNKDVGNLENIKSIQVNKKEAVVAVKLTNLVSSNT
jgi:hypothetical protein